MSETDTAKSDDDDGSPSDSFAMAIGYVCVEWGLLEGTFDRFMRQLFSWSHRDEITHILNINIRQADKIKIIEAVGAAYSPSPEWLERLNKTLRAVKLDIQPSRNRVVHDMWSIGQSDSASRRTRISKVSYPKYQLQVSAFSDTSTHISEVLNLVTKIREVSEELNRLATEYGEIRHR
jgi:hypothetical protein